MKYYPAGKFVLQCPDDLWALEFIKREPLYDRMWASTVLPFMDGYGMVIDIGANIGDTAAAIRSHLPYWNIACMEGDEKILPYLDTNIDIIGGDIWILPKFWENDNDTKAFTDLHEIELIKTDTDGLDGDIVMSFLKTGDYFFYFEADSKLSIQRTGRDLLPDVFKTMIERGYSFIFFANWGKPLAALDKPKSLNEVADILNKTKDIVAYYDVWAFPPSVYGYTTFKESNHFITKYYVQ